MSSTFFQSPPLDMSLAGQFRCQRTAAAGQFDVSIGRRRPQSRFARARTCSVSLRRKQRVVTTTVMSGRMSFDETQKALDTQLRQSSLAKKEEAEGNLSSPASVSQSLKMEAEIMQEEAVSRAVSQKTEAENVQREVMMRTGSMDEDQIANAIQRQVGATPADWSGDEEEEESMADIVIVDESAAAEKAKEEAPESPPAVTAQEEAPESPPAEEPEEEAVESTPAGIPKDDGTLVFSAEALQAVAYDDIKLPNA